MAGKQGSATKLIENMNKWPQDSTRYIESAKILMSSDMKPEAMEALKRATRFNSDDYSAWYLISINDKNSDFSKLAIAELHRLNPLDSRK